MGRRSNYTSKQKAEIVLNVLTKQVTLAEVCGSKMTSRCDPGLTVLAVNSSQNLIAASS